MTDAASLANLRRQVGDVLRSPRASFGLLGGLAGVILVLGLSSLASVIMDGWIQRDLDLRSTLIFRAISDRAAQPGAGDMQAIEADMQKIAEDERIYGLAFCTRDGKLTFATAAIPRPFDCAQFSTPRANEGVTIRTTEGDHVRFNRFALTMGGTPGQLLVAQNLDEARSGERDALTYATAAVAAVAFGLGFLAVVVVYTLRQSWMASLRGAIAESIRTNTAKQAPVVTSGEGPVDRRISALLGDLRVRRKFVHGIYVRWSPDSLRQLLLDQLPDVQVMIVSNREPYIHNRVDGEIKLQTPASGLVSALEPVMRACRGVWIAHGGGSADHETVDKHSRLMVPPDDPTYSLRRVWLTEEEQDGYYYGLANEGLWPLCHIAFIRPQFREPDWAMYRAVNQRFADVVAEEATSENPIVLVQDYHFALLPRMIRNALPKATIVTFWHIPWPNAETFSICPWREEILDGLLGSSILGFHTQFHCNNFFDSVDRFIESRVDHENSLVSFGGRETLVRPYPISIEWPPRGLLNQPSIEQCRINVRERFGLAPDTRIAVGVERFDYTKGILDRMRAVDDLLAMSPQWREKFVLIQVAAPTRSKLDAYSELEKEAERLAGEINAKHQRGGWKPIILLVRHHEPREVFELFRASDVCVVSSLHDGMNLVAKEFVAARDDERGVLILSSFAGAAYELPEALIVNPYDTHQMAKAYERAITMSEDEQAARMQIMVAQISERNVYRWAAQMLFDASWLRKRENIVGNDQL
jgi:trehalose 6-phosphate synthase